MSTPLRGERKRSPTPAPPFSSQLNLGSLRRRGECARLGGREGESSPPGLPLPTAPCPSSISGASALCKGEPGSLDLRRQESHMTSTESSHEIMATLFWLKTFLVLMGSSSPTQMESSRFSKPMFNTNRNKVVCYPNILNPI